MPFADSQEQESESRPAHREMDFIPNYSCVCSPDLCLIVYQQLPLPESRDEATAIPALPCSNNPSERPCLTLCSKVCQWEHRLHGKQWDEVLETSSSCCCVMQGPRFQLGSACTSQAGKSSWTLRVVTAWIGPSSAAHLFQARKSFLQKLPNSRVVCWSGSPQWYMWLLGKSILIWF